MIDKALIIKAIVTGLLMTVFVYLGSRSDMAIAFLAGYGLFSANVFALSYVISLLVEGLRDKHISPDRQSGKLFAVVIGSLKFIGLMLGLYLALVYFKLPGILFAAGAVAALVVVVVLFSLAYLKDLSHKGSK